MKKFTKKLKGKKVLSLVLAAIMLATTFNMALPMLKLDASAADGYVTNGTIASTGITQTRVVDTTNEAYKATYAAYASDYLDGCSEPTDIVIPGLDPNQDYVIQGMTYYPKEDWFFVTAYHNDGNASSKVFCLDAATGEFVALLDFYDVGTQNLNKDHGGGIAISEHNIYYSCGDKDRSVAYAPLSALDGITKGEYRTIQLIGEQTFYEVGSVTEVNEKNVDNGGVDSAYTAYVCYDQGVLWMGNFFDSNSGDYGKKANESYDNMVFGYRLSGSTSTEEWANLTSNTQNCQGNPSYVIALADDSTTGIDIKWVQYATVDSGKLYLSRSASTGGNKVGNMYDKYSHLTVADIDLTTPGTSPTTTIKILTDANGTTKEIPNAYVLSSYHDYQMMPMSEGLCVVDDYLFVTYEGASNKFLNEAGSGIGGLVNDNCPEPVDVIWKVDQYELLGVRRDDNRETACYEKVDDISSINNTDEYIVVYESDEKNPVTQEHILYALDSHGGHNGFNLPKEGLNNQYDTTKPDHTVGIVGHKISEYDIDGNKLYLTYPEDDDVENIRWKFVGSNGSYTLKNSSKYFTEYHTLQVSGVEASMAKSTSIGITLTDMGETWRIQSGGEYLWCNDGTHSLENTINSYYTSYCNNKGVASYTEQPGTFHSNATSTSNVLGRALTTSEDSYREFEIYKRVIDEYASTEDSRVYTSMDAALQEDGTYTINLETYATAETQYQTLQTERPTDFIFVLDGSGSMATADCSGYIRYNGQGNNVLAISGICSDSDSVVDCGSWFTGFDKGVIGYKFTGNIRYYTPEDGKYNQVYIASNTTELNTDWKGGLKSLRQEYWVYYISETDGLCYLMHEDGSVSETGVDFETTLKKWVDAGTNETSYSNATGSKDERAGKVVFNGVHYEYKTSGVPRIDCLKTALNNLIFKISEDSQKYTDGHRIAVTQFGSWHIAGDNKTKENWLNTGMYANDSTKFLQYSTSDSDYFGDSETIDGGDANTKYANAFYTVDNFDDVRKIIENINVTQTNPDPDTFSNFAFDMANGIINNSGKDYLATGDRNVAIIMITDGVPGWGSDYPDMANTVADIAITETYEAKSNGASVYSVQIGNNSIDDFSMKLYMDAVSSEYVTSKSRTDLGDRNPDSIDYHIDVSTGTPDMFNTIADSIFNSVQANSKAGLVHLDTASIIREELEGAFIMDDAEFSASLVPGSHDKIGRMTFGEPVAKTLSEKEKYAACTNGEIAYNQDASNLNKLEIWGYDYTDQYISASHPGNKLRITISGVLANSSADLTNTSINNNSTTAIYKDSTWLGKERAFKRFPTEYFTIPEYTYVLDYGLDMLDQNVNGTLMSVSEDLSAQRDENGNIAYNTVSENGLVKITNKSQDLLYHTTPTNMNDSGYVLIQRPTEEGEKAKYDWFEIKVVPASNVYFEEDDMNVKKADEGTTKAAWTTAGTKIKDYRNLTEEGDVVGFENAYDVAYDSSKESTAYSNGTAKKVTVTQSNRNSKTQTFDFVGTGVDIVSRCGSDTGILLVNIKNSAGKSIAASIVDTYCEAGTFNQTPVFSWSIDNAKGETYGTYTVEVSALYLSNAGALNPKSINKSNLIDTGLKMNTSASFDEDVLQAMLDEAGVEDVSAKDVDLVWFDDNSIFNGGTGVAPTKKGTRNTTTVTELVNYIDGFRVYNPLGTDPSVYTEKNVSYANVIDNLAATTPDTTIADGIAFITGLGSGVNVSFEQYKQAGPKGELYLNAGKAISFKIDRAVNEKVMLGLRAVDGATTINVNGYAIDKGINSATEMYYDISNCIKNSGKGVTITVENTGSNRVAINHIKFSGGDASNGTVVTPRSLARSADATEAQTNKFLPLTQEDLVAIEAVMSAEPIPTVVKNGVVIPLVEEEEEIPEDNTNTDNDNTNDGTDTEESEDGGFGILSLIKMLIAFIEQILRNALGAGSIA